MDRYEQAVREMVILLRHDHPEDALAVGETALGSHRRRRAFRKTEIADLLQEKGADHEAAGG